MKRLFCLLISLSILGLLVNPQDTQASSPIPIRGLHCAAPTRDEVEMCAKFIREALPKEGVNLLVLEFNYHYQFAKHPEVSDPDALSEQEVKKLVEAAREGGIQLIPMINCLGHQSWAKTMFGLLKSHPELDETPGKYPDNEGIYCRSYCPLQPALHGFLFDLIDELADVCEAKAFHVGMDEVFLLGEDDCPRCKGKNKAELFAQEVHSLHDHLAGSNRTMWMWGDRFLDGNVTGIGKWEASENGTAPSISQVPQDIVICDWHYERAEPTAAYFALQGFPVVSCPWRQAEVALDQLHLIQSVRESASEPVASRLQGVLQTTWVDAGAFVKAYNGETGMSKEALEALYCFRTLFAELRKGGMK
jgi:hypothetical protein